MKIYIGLDYNGKPTSVLLANSREKADIAWMGMKDTPHNVEEIDPNNEKLGMHGIVFLLTSKESLIDRATNIKIRDWKRGL